MLLNKQEPAWLPQIFYNWSYLCFTACIVAHFLKCTYIYNLHQHFHKEENDGGEKAGHTIPWVLLNQCQGPDKLMGHHWGLSPVRDHSSFLQDGNAQLQECLFGLVCPSLVNWFSSIRGLAFSGHTCEPLHNYCPLSLLSTHYSDTVSVPEW